MTHLYARLRCILPAVLVAACGVSYDDPPDIVLNSKLNTIDVVGITDKTSSELDHTFITAMGLLRVGYDTIVGSSDTDSVKDKLNRILRV